MRERHYQSFIQSSIHLIEEERNTNMQSINGKRVVYWIVDGSTTSGTCILTSCVTPESRSFFHDEADGTALLDCGRPAGHRRSRAHRKGDVGGSARHRGRRDDHARAGHHRDDGGLLRVRTQNQLSSRWLLLAVSRICTNMAFRLPTWVHTGHHRDNGRILRVRTVSAQLSVTVISGFKNMCQYGSPLTVMGAHRIPPIIFI